VGAASPRTLQELWWGNGGLKQDCGLDPVSTHVRLVLCTDVGQYAYYAQKTFGLRLVLLHTGESRSSSSSNTSSRNNSSSSTSNACGNSTRSSSTATLYRCHKHAYKMVLATTNVLAVASIVSTRAICQLLRNEWDFLSDWQPMLRCKILEVAWKLHGFLGNCSDVAWKLQRFL